MARAIDADILAWGLKLHFQSTDQECELDRQWAVGYNAGLERALYSISHSKKLDTVEQEWISVKDRLPTKEDANKGHYILAILKVEGYGNAWHWDMVANHPEAFSCWMPLPEPPEKEEK